MDNPYQSDPLHIDDANPFRSPLSEEPTGPQVNRTEERLNPWFSMWTRPRQTIRQVIETDPRRYVLLLAILSGLTAGNDLDFDFTRSLDYRLGMVLVGLGKGAIGGVFFLYLWGWLVGLGGRQLGGVATAEHTRAAMAWSQIPSVWILPISLIFDFGMQIWGEGIFAQIDEETYPLFVVLLMLPFIVIAIWQLILTCCAIGEVNQFSSVKGFGALMIGGVMATAIFLAIFIPVMMVFGLTDSF